MPRSRTRRGKKDAAAERKQVRVAIYCRKSTEKNLDGFNSLDAQRAAVESYVQSQKAKGWVALPDRYDDAGFTGANTNRPAFQRLLQDIKAGRIDLVAVYRYDRLSRSLLDFLRLLKFFHEQGVDFVSTTQNIDTTSSLGRLQANVLMSFNEYEREAISERTKDKIRAARHKGLWTGGRPVLGFDVKDKALVVNEEEAEQVRDIFRLYLDLGSLLAVVHELDLRGRKNKTLHAQNGNVHQGKVFNKQAIRFILGNPLYQGKVRCNGNLHDGVHEAIIDQETWQAVQDQLEAHAKRTGYIPRRSRSFLSGLLFCGICGKALSPHYAAKEGKRYRYYCCLSAQKRGAKSCHGSRIPAAVIEAFVIDKVKEIGQDSDLVAEAVKEAKQQLKEQMPGLIRKAKRLEAEQRKLARERNNMVDAIADNGNGSASLTERLAEMDEALEKLVAELESVKRQIASLDRDAIDEGDFKEAISSFTPVWDQLFPEERSRLLHLLIEKIVYNAEDGELAITFRSGGIKALAADNSETAA